MSEKLGQQSNNLQERESQQVPENSEPIRENEPEDTTEDELVKKILEKFEENLKSLFVQVEIQADKAKKAIRENEDNKQKFLTSLDKEGFDLNNKDDIGGLGDVIAKEVNKLFGKKYNLSVPEEKLPIVVVKEGIPAHVYFRNKDGKKIPISSIEISTIQDILNGNYFCEEMGHFYRYYFEPDQEDEEITGEFFGFLGKRLWKKAIPELDEELKVLIDYQEQGVISKKYALDLSKNIKEKIKLGTENNLNELFLGKLKQERRDILVHQRGYEYASKLDLDKIHDWKKLFSLSNGEVRKRFFTSNQDYSGL